MKTIWKLRISWGFGLFLIHKEDLKKFLNDVIEETSNRLFLALVCYIHSEWFEIGCRVFSFFGEKLVKSLCEVLGTSQKREDRNWKGLKAFNEKKIVELNSLVNDTKVTSNYDKLIVKCAETVKENLD